MCWCIRLCMCVCAHVDVFVRVEGSFVDVCVWVCVCVGECVGACVGACAITMLYMYCTIVCAAVEAAPTNDHSPSLHSYEEALQALADSEAKKESSERELKLVRGLGRRKLGVATS